ncbi:MAG TPA: hypothetical protein VNU48_08685 [Burkholderiaceae bacterium]|nr:hypothetical protein [Burkholderiaceae bacterium]
MPYSLRSSCATLLAATGLLLSGCASTGVDAQWRSVELPPGYLHGATVLVSCETGELVLQRICEDRVVADLAARGVRAVLSAPNAAPAAPAGVTDMQYVPVARDAGAKAVFSVSVGVASQMVNPGVSLGLGVGGFGRYSAGGIGVSAPVGGGQVNSGYAMSGRVTDVASGRLMWTARAIAPPSSDANAQLAELSKSLLDAAAGLF